MNQKMGKIHFFEFAETSEPIKLVPLEEEIPKLLTTNLCTKEWLVV